MHTLETGNISKHRNVREICCDEHNKQATAAHINKPLH